ncbi:MAG: carboxylesterase family protein, partial [Streptomyces sp.]|nr:carboxylesterase family protein [Streptomyces sp.]
LRLPLHRLADARPGTSYVYEFAWPSNLPALGSCHALELGFVFDTGESPESAKLAGDGAPQELSDAMHGAWVRFAVDGNPGWPAWDDTHPVRIFGDGEPHTAHGPLDAELALWAADLTPAESAPAALPAAGWPTRSTELRSVVRRLRLPGSVRRP